MKYIKTYDNFKPIKVNSHKPFKVKKNLDTSIKYLQKGIYSDRKRIQKQKDINKRAELNRNASKKIKKLSDLQFAKIKQTQYLKDNPITENTESKGKLLKCLESIVSGEIKPDKILKYIKLEDYENRSIYDKNLSIWLKSSELEKLMNVENGIIKYLFYVASDYGRYEYYIEDDELNYLDNYLTEDSFKAIQDLAKVFDYEIDVKERGEIKKMFDYLELNDELDTFKNEIRMENKRAIQEAAKKLIYKTLPFKLENQQNYTYNNKENYFDLIIIFDYITIIEYIKKHKLEINSIKELFENIYESNDFCYDFEYTMKDEFIGDFSELNIEVYNSAQNLEISPEKIFPIWIKNDNIDLFKKYLELADFISSSYVFINYNRKYLNLFDIAKNYNGKILEWFKTYDFQKKLIDENDIFMYKSLIKSDIINPDIKDEFEYLIAAKDFNL